MLGSISNESEFGMFLCAPETSMEWSYILQRYKYIRIDFIDFPLNFGNILASDAAADHCNGAVFSPSGDLGGCISSLPYCLDNRVPTPRTDDP